MNGKITYIFGHKNPDTDSVCASIALSYLKNKMGMNTVASTLGNLNPETKYALNYFGVKEPYHLNDVKLQLKDIEYLKEVYSNKSNSILKVYNYLTEKGITGTPIVDDDDNYVGIVTLKDIVRKLFDSDVEKLDTTYSNIIDVLKGEEVLKFDDEIKGNILVASYNEDTFNKNIKSLKPIKYYY